MNLSEMLPGDVGVNLGGRNIDMAQHHLDGSQVSTAFQKMTGKGVPDTVGCYFFFDPRPLCILF